MKLKLNLQYSSFHSDYDNFENLKVEATTSDYNSEYHITFKTVTVEIPDDVGLTEKEYKQAFYLKHLSAAELEVQKKRDELTRAEEVVKNMKAIEYQG